MKRFTSLCLFVMLAASPSRSSDQITIASLPPVPSDVGKMPFFGVLGGPPPHSRGPGLHFDTHRYFYVYTDYAAPANHFAPSGWMGDSNDIRLDDASTDDPADGRTCIKINYLARGSQGFGWAGLYWQQPKNNWGGLSGGYNLAGMKRLTFWARSAVDDVSIAVFKVGGVAGPHPDSDSAQIGPVTLSREWQQFSIDLTGADMKNISGGFAWSVAQFDNTGPVTFYLDEIRYER